MSSISFNQSNDNYKPPVPLKPKIRPEISPEEIGFDIDEKAMKFSFIDDKGNKRTFNIKQTNPNGSVNAPTINKLVDKIVSMLLKTGALVNKAEFSGAKITKSHIVTSKTELGYEDKATQLLRDQVFKGLPSRPPPARPGASPSTQTTINAPPSPTLTPSSSVSSTPQTSKNLQSDDENEQDYERNEQEQQFNVEANEDLETIQPLPTSTSQRKGSEATIEKLIGETMTTEETFMKQTTEITVRLYNLTTKEEYKDNLFLKNYYNQILKAQEKISAFYNLMADAVKQGTPADKINNLQNVYKNSDPKKSNQPSDAFMQYSESITSLTVMYQELIKLEKENKSLQGLIMGKSQSGGQAQAQPIIFAQRIPRHEMLLNAINKESENQLVNTAHDEAIKTNNAINSYNFIYDLEDAQKGLLGMSTQFKNEKLMPSLPRLMSSFSTFANALENPEVYFPRKDEKEYQELKQNLIRTVLKARSDDELQAYQKYALKKYPALATNKKDVPKDVADAYSDALHNLNYQSKIKDKPIEELLDDQTKVHEYIKGLQTLATDSKLDKSVAKLVADELQKVQRYDRLISYNLQQKGYKPPKAA